LAAIMLRRLFSGAILAAVLGLLVTAPVVEARQEQVANGAKAPEQWKEGARRLGPRTADLAGRDAFIPRSLADAVPFKPFDEEYVEVPSGRAPPANDACSAATNIFDTGVFAFDNTEATTDGLGHFGCSFFGQTQISKDVWFRWTAPAAASYRIETCGLTSLDTKIALYTGVGACPPNDARLIQCNDDACGSQSRITFSATAGASYLIRIGVFPSTTGGTGSFRLVLTPGQDICLQPASQCQAQDFATAYDATSMVAYDDFRVAQNGSVTKVCFFGAYFNGVNDCEAASDDDFVVEYYASFGGVPGAFPIAEFQQSQMTLTGPIPTGQTVGAGFPVYAYVLEHPGVAVSANTCYWLSIRNFTTNGCVWFWQAGNGGNGLAFHSPDFAGFEDVISDDFAFCLNIPLGQATLCADPTAPVNDSCAGASPLVCGAQYFIQNVFATTEPTDPAFPCRGGGSEQGFGTLWYTFVPSETSARISLCQNQNMGDTLMAAYTGTCGNLTQIACNDDFCGRRSQMLLNGLTPGQTYYIQIASYDPDSQDRYALLINCPIPAAPPNDLCSNAILINVPPGGSAQTGHSTVSAGIELDVPTCDFSPIVSPTIWYKVVGTGETMVASLCNTTLFFDTKMSVFCGTCTDLTCVASSDDECGNQARVEWCSAVGETYTIMVHGFNGQVGSAVINVFSDPEVPCPEPPVCTSCSLECPPGAVPENEPCAGFLNDGCNSANLDFEPIASGQTICGNASALNGTRDTDWFEFDVPTASEITWSVEAELPVDIILLDDTCFPTPKIIAQGQVERCGAGSITARVPAGTYRVFVGNTGDGYPCGTSNTYIATLDCVPLGACCTGVDCTIATEAECDLVSGVFGGDGSACPTVYTPEVCMNPFLDIEQTGTDLELGNDDAIEIDIGFDFRFYGETHSRVVVSSEGYLNFGEVAPTTPNVPIPSATPPNALVAPLWDDFSPGVAGSVTVETLGTAPDRRLIVQWTSVPRFQQADVNTFQAVLFEGSNCIEFRYQVFSAAVSSNDYTVGVENHAGDAGTAIDPLSLAPGGCVRLCPITDPGDCVPPPPPGCEGDANGDGVVDFDDITAVLSNWLTAGPEGDANGNGIVDFDDLTAVLGDWLCTSIECEGDANGDLQVDFDDIVEVLANWNTASEAGDANHNGFVDFDDIVAVLANWNSGCAGR